jgi:hypothetical protein
MPEVAPTGEPEVGAAVEPVNDAGVEADETEDDERG